MSALRLGMNHQYWQGLKGSLVSQHTMRVYRGDGLTGFHVSHFLIEWDHRYGLAWH